MDPFTSILALLFCVGLIFAYLAIRKNNKKKNQEMSLKKNPYLLNEIHLNQLFKVYSVDEKMNIIFLRCDPSYENPFGLQGGSWYKVENIPPELCHEGKVVKVVKDEFGKITCCSHPIF